MADDIFVHAMGCYSGIRYDSMILSIHIHIARARARAAGLALETLRGLEEHEHSTRPRHTYARTQALACTP